MLVSRLTRRFRGDSTLIFIANGTFGVSRIKITIYENDTDIMGIEFFSDSGSSTLVQSFFNGISFIYPHELLPVVLMKMECEQSWNLYKMINASSDEATG